MWLEADPLVESTKDTLHAYVVRCSDDWEVNQSIIHQGHARAVRRPTFSRQAEFVKAEQEPATAKVGIWAKSWKPKRFA